MYAMFAILIYASSPVPVTNKGVLVFNNYGRCLEALSQDAKNTKNGYFAEDAGEVEKVSFEIDESGNTYLKKINKNQKLKKYIYCKPVTKVD